MSPLAGYNLSPPPTLMDEKAGSRDPIRFYAPETSTIQMTSDEAKSALENAKMVLNIDRSLKSAQSAVAKEMDREPECLEISKISDDMYMKLQHTLEVVQAVAGAVPESGGSHPGAWCHTLYIVAPPVRLLEG